MKRYRVLLLIAFVVLVVFVGLRVREAAGVSYRTPAQLRQVPEEHLFYPGLVVLEQGGRDREIDILGQRIRAASVHTLGTSAMEETVFAFYSERLTVQGWRESGAETRLSSGQARGNAYRRGSLLFQITILRNEDIRNDPAINAYQTAYQIALFADLPK